MIKNLDSALFFMIDRYYVVYERKTSSPILRSYDSEQCYRNFKEDSNGAKVHEGLSQYQAEEIFQKLIAAWEKGRACKR